MRIASIPRSRFDGPPTLVGADTDEGEDRADRFEESLSQRSGMSDRAREAWYVRLGGEGQRGRADARDDCSRDIGSALMGLACADDAPGRKAEGEADGNVCHRPKTPVQETREDTTSTGPTRAPAPATSEDHTNARETPSPSRKVAESPANSAGERIVAPFPCAARAPFEDIAQPCGHQHRPPKLSR